VADVGLTSELVLDIRKALANAGQVERALDAATNLEVHADSRQVTASITAAVDAADSTVAVTATAPDVTASIDAAVDAADESVDVTATAPDVTASINAAVDAADSAVDVTATAPDVTASITAAVDAADSAVEVTATAPDVTASINGAVDAADSAVVVTATASDVTASINGAVDAANTAVTVTVNDDGSVDFVSGSVDDLAGNLGTATAASGNLRTALGFLGVGVVVKGLLDAAGAASDLAESTGKATVVFGDGIDEVQSFARAADTGLGLSESAALEAAGTFGNLFNALGLTKEAATDLAPEVLTLGADLASFNNLGVEETLEKLRSGLVGEIEPLRSIGISFSAADVEAKAFELGLQDASGALSEGAKIQARWKLITEQSTNATGDFARTSEGLANQQRILGAEWDNSVIRIGGGVTPALMELIGVAREDLLPTFEQVAITTIPALADAFLNVLPLVGGFTDLLLAATPLIETAGDVLGAVPPELLQFAAATYAATRVLNPLSDGLSVLSATIGKVRASGGIGAALSGVSTGSLVVAGLAVAIGVLTLAMSQNAAEAAENQQEIRGISDALENARNVTNGYVDALDAIAEEGDLALSFFLAAGHTTRDVAEALRETNTEQELYERLLGKSAAAGGKWLQNISDLEENLRAAAAEQISVGVATGEYTQEAVDAALATRQMSVETYAGTLAATDWVGALDDLTTNQALAKDEIQVANDVIEENAGATGRAAVATDRFALTLAALGEHGDPARLLAFAEAAADGAITEDQMADAAGALGVSLEDLQGFVTAVTDEVGELANTALGTIPTISDLIGGMGDEFSAAGLLEELAKTTEAIIGFQDNIAALAAFPEVQRIAAENGPLVAAALAQPIKDGNTQIVADLEAQTGLYNQAYEDLDTNLRDKIAPEIAVATGDVATQATDAFGANFNPATPAKEKTDEATRTIAEETPRWYDVASLFGIAGTEAVRVGLGGMPHQVSNAAAQSKERLAGQAGSMAAIGRIFGGAGTDGARAGLGGMAGAGAAAAIATSAAVRGQTVGAAAAGSAVGGAIGAGLTAGINSSLGNAIRAATSLVSSAVSAARRTAGVQSPSTEFAEIGRQIGAGLALGIRAAIPDVRSAASDASLAAIAEAHVAAHAAQIAPPAPDVLAAVGAPGFTGGATTTVLVAEGAVQIVLPGDVTPDQAARTAQVAGRAFLTTLAERQVFVRARTG